MRFIEITPQQKHTNAPPIPKEGQRHSCESDARNHYPRIKHHTPPPSGATTVQPPPRAATPTTGARTPPTPQTPGRGGDGPVVSGPNSVSGSHFRPTISHADQLLVDAPGRRPLQGRPPISQPHRSHGRGGGGMHGAP